MDDDMPHELELEAEYPTGATEWWCPECGYRAIVQRSPVFQCIVIHPGDKRAHPGQPDLWPDNDADAMKKLSELIEPLVLDGSITEQYRGA